jgi:hypothetical protein
VSDVPQVGQNVRVTGGVEWNADGVPRSQANPSASTVIQATAGAPAACAQERQ